MRDRVGGGERIVRVRGKGGKRGKLIKVGRGGGGEVGKRRVNHK